MDNPFMPNDDVMNQQAQQPQQQISGKMVRDATNLRCEKCQSQIFDQKLIVKRLSPIVTGLPQETIIHVPVLTCAQCGTPLPKGGGDLIQEDIIVKKKGDK